MIDQQHPITPPPESVQQWLAEPGYGTSGRATLHTMSEPRLTQMLTRAAQWGADQELDATCAWFCELPGGSVMAADLRAARRPKPPSLKEQALGALKHLALGPDPTAFLADMETIRRAFAAQAVMDAAFPAYDDIQSNVVTGEQHAGLIAAAAIRAAADQVVPEEKLLRGDQRWMFEHDARQVSRNKLLAIATELENHQ